MISGSIATLVIGSAGALVVPAVASAATNTTVYSNVPNTLPGNYPSQAYEATSTSEFGGQVKFANTAQNPTVTVIMSSWGCETGSWNNNNCVTTPGATFSEPITLNVYNVGAGNSVGSLAVSQTKTFDIPYRPSANSSKCGTTGEWYSKTDKTCYNGMNTPVSFDLSGVTLPNPAILSLAYDTSDYGAHPYGDATACHATSGGCGYDSLNVSLAGNPSVGSQPIPDSAYLDSTWTGAYCDDGAAGTGTFRLDSGCWTGYQPAMEVVSHTSSSVTKIKTINIVTVNNVSVQNASSGNAVSKKNTSTTTTKSGSAKNTNTSTVTVTF